MLKNLDIKKGMLTGILCAFLLNSFGPLPARADEFLLPKPGVVVPLSPAFNPPILKGIKVHPENPFRFEFILDKGDGQLDDRQLKNVSSKLIKYFLASLTIPEKDLWVNLSPYEKNRIIPQSFGLTEMGRDLLAEDYMLKQVTASLIYPEGETGKKFWKCIYTKAIQKFGTTDIPVNTFNKVWIVPEKAVVYENAKAGAAYVVESKLKVMVEQDYLALMKNGQTARPQKGIPLKKKSSVFGSQIFREIVIPQLSQEINNGRNFVQLRQVYHSLILAAWYKKKIKDSLLTLGYADKHKIAGIKINDALGKQRIYELYLQAFKKGAYNYIREEIDPVTNQAVPRKYFSGGVRFGLEADRAMTIMEGVPDMNLLNGHHIFIIRARLNAAQDKAAISHPHPKSRSGQPQGYPTRADAPDSWGDMDSHYVPPEYTAPVVLANDETKFTADALKDPTKGWADPVDPTDVKSKFLSYEGKIFFDRLGRPRNPKGPTGIAGRGNLGRWGPNHAVDPIVTRYSAKTGKLQVLAVLREDARQWALPGGFVDRGEEPLNALTRELKEETGAVVDMRQGETVYKGYVDDPRNTDNAWIETVAMHVHVSYEQSRQLISSDRKEENIVASWLDVEDEMNAGTFYASHGEFLKALLERWPLTRTQETASNVRRIVSSPMAVKYDQKLDFKANTYAGYSAELSRRERKEFERHFMEDLVEAIKAYEQSGEWKYYHVEGRAQLRKSFIEPGEGLFEAGGALDKNGFFSSPEYYINRIVRPYLRATLLSGDHVGERVAVYLDLTAKKGTGAYEAQIKARNLVRDIVKGVTNRYYEGELLLDVAPTNPVLRWAWRFANRATVPLVRRTTNTVMTVSAGYALYKVFGHLLTKKLLGIVSAFLGIVVLYVAYYYISEAIAVKLRPWIFKKTIKYYDNKLLSYILDFTPFERKRIEVQYHDNFQKMRGLDESEASIGLLDEVEKIIFRGLRERQQYLWASKIGLELVESGISVDARDISIVMLKELADQNSAFFKRLEEAWKKRKEREDWLFNLMGWRRTKPTLPAVFSEMIPLIQVQQNEPYMRAKAHEMAEQVRAGAAAPQLDSYGQEPEFVVQLRELISGDGFDAGDHFVDHLYVQLNDMNDAHDRRSVILSYFMAGGVARLRLVRENLEAGRPFNIEYSDSLNRSAKYHWVRILNKIKERPAFYGLTAEEIDLIIEKIDAQRIYTTAETLRREILSRVPSWLYRGMTAEIGVIVENELKGRPASSPQTPSYALFQKIVSANSEYWEELAGIFHQGYLRAQKGQADADEVHSAAYQRSILVDARLFDKEYNPVTAAKLAETLESAGFGDVNIFLGNLSWPGHPMVAAYGEPVKFKMYHLKPVQEYLRGHVSLADAKEQVLEFYRLGKSAASSAGLDAELVRKINEQFEYIERMKRPGVSPEAVESLKDQMAVIINPLAVPWGYLMKQVPQFGEHAQERKEWLLSLQTSIVGVIGLLQNEHFFDEFNGMGDSQRGDLKLKKLLQYYHVLLEMRTRSAGPSGQNQHSLNWLVGEGDVLESYWFVIKEMITELGLAVQERFKDIIAAGDRAAQQQHVRGVGDFTDILSADLAQSASLKGGIDFNSSKLNLQVQDGGLKIHFQVDPAMVEQIENAAGLTPDIISIQPAADIRPFLGLSR